MKAIVTRYHGPTDTKGARVSAHAEGMPRKFYAYQHGARDMHLYAATEYVTDCGWAPESIVGGQIPNGDHCWVLLTGAETHKIA